MFSPLAHQETEYICKINQAFKTGNIEEINSIKREISQIIERVDELLAQKLTYTIAEEHYARDQYGKALQAYERVIDGLDYQKVLLAYYRLAEIYKNIDDVWYIVLINCFKSGKFLELSSQYNSRLLNGIKGNIHRQIRLIESGNAMENQGNFQGAVNHYAIAACHGYRGDEYKENAIKKRDNIIQNQGTKYGTKIELAEYAGQIIIEENIFPDEKIHDF